MRGCRQGFANSATACPIDTFAAISGRGRGSRGRGDRGGYESRG